VQAFDQEMQAAGLQRTDGPREGEPDQKAIDFLINAKRTMPIEQQTEEIAHVALDYLPRLLELGTRVFEDGVRLMADCFGIELDEVKFIYELGACTKDVDLGWYKMPAGSLGGCVLRYVGTVDDVKRVELRMDWLMTPHTDPHWDIQGCYITKIEGDPCIYSKHMILPKPGTDFSSVDAFAKIGMSVTAVPALNAIPAVVAAPPGIVTSADLPLRAFSGRFAR